MGGQAGRRVGGRTGGLPACLPARLPACLPARLPACLPGLLGRFPEKKKPIFIFVLKVGNRAPSSRYSPQLDSSGSGQTLGSTRADGQNDGSYTLTPSNEIGQDADFFVFFCFLIFVVSSQVCSASFPIKLRLS